MVFWVACWKQSSNPKARRFQTNLDITYRFSSGWRRVHNPITGHDVADDLTTTEFTVAMFTARGWTQQEIAERMNISVNTVKSYIAASEEQIVCKESKRTEKIHAFIGKMPAEISVGITCFRGQMGDRFQENFLV